MARKDRKVLRNCGFWRFRGVKMLILVQNDETRSKLDKIRAGPTQIDPRGSNGPLKSENRSIYAGQVLKNPGWLSGDPNGHPQSGSVRAFCAAPCNCTIASLPGQDWAKQQ